MLILYLIFFQSGLITLPILSRGVRAVKLDEPCGAVASRRRNAGEVRKPGGGAVVLEPLLSYAHRTLAKRSGLEMNRNTKSAHSVTPPRLLRHSHGRLYKSAICREQTYQEHWFGQKEDIGQNRTSDFLVFKR